MIEGAICIEDIIAPCVITSMSAYQMAMFARKVGKARSKYKISPPATDGDANFVRVFRAQQNSCELYPIFLASLWSSSLLLHQGPPAVLGLLYMLGRAKYFRGYSEAAEKRMAGFKLTVNALQGLQMCAGVGLLHFVFVKLTGNTLLTYMSSIML